MNDTLKPRRDLYQEVTDKIVASIEAGTAPWLRPWADLAEMGMPQNGLSNRPYSGVNTALLFMASQAQGYDSNRWYTYKQAAELGAQVRRGEKSTAVVFFKMLQASERGNDASQDKSRTIPFLTEYRVFNASQIDGLAPEQKTVRSWTPIEAVNEVVARLKPDIRFGGNRAFYAVGHDRDFIQMPHEGAFPSAESFSSTLLHEISHWTGAEQRLNRQFGAWGSENYDREEIRADLASSFLCAELGVPTNLDANAAYIGSFVRRLKSDKFEIFRAMKDASRIAEFVTGRLVLEPVDAPTITPAASPAPVLQPIATPAVKALLAIKPKRAPRSVSKTGSIVSAPTMPPHALTM